MDQDTQERLNIEKRKIRIFAYGQNLLPKGAVLALEGSADFAYRGVVLAIHAL
jgi:hypothetical protein